MNIKLLVLLAVASLSGCAYYSQGPQPDGPLPYQQPGTYPVYSTVNPICYFQPFYVPDAYGRPVLAQRMVCQ